MSRVLFNMTLSNESRGDFEPCKFADNGTDSTLKKLDQGNSYLINFVKRAVYIGALATLIH